MAAIIHDPEQFARKLETLSRAGGKGEIAARQARELMRKLADSDLLDAALRKKLTRNGEARKENCWKFQLVSGYRLIFTQRDGAFVLLFLGTHDETDNWFKNNAGLKLDELSLDKSAAVPCSQGAEDHVEESGTMLQAVKDDYEKPLHEILDQKTLREIFWGLCVRPARAAG